MSPTDPRRNSSSPAPNGKDENPFIKFKRFADAQIGAVLQGVIGLPSVFSKQPNDAANSRWADLHDDLKRRDEIRAEQQDSQASNSTGSQDNFREDEEKFVKGLNGQPLPTRTKPEGEEADPFSTNMRDFLPHLFGRPLDGMDWTTLKHPPRPLNCICLAGPTAHKFIILPDEQRKGSAVEMIQKTVLNTFYLNASFGGYNPMQSSQSILPYILFSPYSPLALSSNPGPSNGGPVSVPDKEDDFPYCEAFQDLLLASKGQSMSTWALVPYKYKRTPESNSESRKALAGMCWIDSLYNYGLLTKDPRPSVSFAELSSTPFGVRFEKKQLYGKESKFPHLKSLSGSDAVEEEKYALLDDPAGQVKGPILIGDLMAEIDTLEALFDFEDEDRLAQRLKIGIENETHSRTIVSSRSIKADSTQNEYDGPLRFLRFGDTSSGGTSTSTQTETVLNQDTQPGTTKSEKSVQDSAAPPSRTDKDQVVCTTTTTEHVANEKGSTHTTVRVSKLYVDGRTLVTSTSKANIAPLRGPHGEEVRLDAVEDDGRCAYCDAILDDETEENQTSKQTHDKKSKGWFWN